MVLRKMDNTDLAVLLLLLAGYFLPVIIADLKGRLNVGAIFITNLIFGWTIIGWLACLIWSLTYAPDPQKQKKLKVVK
jgi:hypothetical protein